MIGVEPRASHVLGQCSAMELYLEPIMESFNKALIDLYYIDVRVW